MSAVRIVNRTRGTVLGSHVRVAHTWWSRLRGYLGRSRPDAGEGILLVPCNAIHTYGMAFPLDVLFLDESGRVLRRVRDVRPWTRPNRVNAARYVLEVPVGTIEATETREGDELTWLPPRSSLPEGSTWTDGLGARARHDGPVGSRGDFT